MKKALLVALVVVVVFTGLPVLMGSAGMPACPECGPSISPIAAGCAVAVLIAFTVFIALAFRRLRPRPEWYAALLLVLPFDRPPRLA